MAQEENTTSVVFSAMLKRALADRNLTQTQIAESLDISQAAISKWFNGTVPKGSELLKLSRLLRVSMEELLTGSDSHCSTVIQEQGSGYSTQRLNDWKDRAVAAERKIESLKTSLESLLKKF